MLLFPYISPSPHIHKSIIYVYFSIVALQKFFSTIFLDSIYMHQNIVFNFLFLTYFTLDSSTSLELTQIYSFLWLIFHCIYIPLLYPFSYQWTSRLLPCSSYCKQCCNKHWDTCVIFNFCLLRVYAQELDCWVIWWFYSQFFKESP